MKGVFRVDLILINGDIVTMNPSNPRAEALAVKGDRFIKIGNNQEILSLKTDKTKIIDLENNLLVPGFNDAHLHLLNYGYSLKMIDLASLKSINEIINKAKDFISTNNIAPGEWIRGKGWNHEFFIDEKRFPNRYDLDKISTEHPICITRACLHVAVVNSKALELIGINSNIPKVEGGYIDLDKEGKSLGIFRENARYLVYDSIEDPNMEEIKEMIVAAANDALSHGITSVQSDDFEALPSKDFKKVIRAYTELTEEKKLPIRVYEQCLLPQIDKLNEFLELGYSTGYGNDVFKIGPLKLLGDGSLGARTAYMCEPYADDPSTCGIPVFTQEELDNLVITAHNADIQVAIHCIGDRSMYMAFDSIERAQKQNYRDDSRHGIVHCQITDSELLNRFTELHAIAYVQPIFTSTDLGMAENRVGKEKIKTSYNWKAMVDTGVHVAFSSDCPVEPLAVLPGIYAAVTRKNLDGYPKGGWMPEQRLTIDEALYGFTLGSAYASFEESIKGSIEEGKLADMAVLSHDIYEIHPDKVKDVTVKMTFVGGKLVYNRS